MTYQMPFRFALSLGMSFLVLTLCGDLLLPIRADEPTRAHMECQAFPYSAKGGTTEGIAVVHCAATDSRTGVLVNNLKRENFGITDFGPTELPSSMPEGKTACGASNSLDRVDGGGNGVYSLSLRMTPAAENPTCVWGPGKHFIAVYLASAEYRGVASAVLQIPAMEARPVLD